MCALLFISAITLVFTQAVYSQEARRPIPGEEQQPMDERQQPDPNRASGLEDVAPPPASADYELTPVPDRWRLLDSLGMTETNIGDPYHRNPIKGDVPLHGDWFLNLTVTSDTVIEPRRLPTPVAPQGTRFAGSNDIFGDGEQLVFNQNLLVGLVYYKGHTTFKPPDWEFRLTTVFNYNNVHAEQNRVLFIDPRDGHVRTDTHVGIQELFVDKHLRNVSARYDFDSLRFGIQPFTADFRGFLFIDEPFGLRLFGTRNNNRIQYNLAAFARIEKDTNSGLNDLSQGLREDYVYVANLYWQDLLVRGHIVEFVLLHNRNTEGEEGQHYNKNGFLERPASLGLEKPRNYHVTYAGINSDGHFGDLNLTTLAYYAFGEEDQGVFVDGPTEIRAGLAAAEFSIDSDWVRWRASVLWASGEENVFDNEVNGFDAVFENPLFAGADTSFWIRQPVPLIGGGGVVLSGRNGLLNSLRSSKEEGQSNFANPGTRLVGLGVDMDITPEVRLSFNVNQLWFDETAVLEVARNQAMIDREIGLDVSTALIWRPYMNQNVIVRASAAALLPGKGFKQLYGDEVAYSVLINIILTY
ncbi:MAG TPA: hypothetical protein VFP95_02290 [Gammaproteobacteria bacterium]|nr:hypothetical protein [Gammaproteobacteria bacterium]